MLMKDPKWYYMLKEKTDGFKEGVCSYSILFAQTKYFLPSVVGDKLVADGYAEEVEFNAGEFDQ